jgi:hypothetical protein
MRWDQLFDDLEAQFDDLADAEMRAELGDRQRVAAGAISMVERLSGASGRQVRCRTAAGITLAGRLSRVGPDWLLIEESPGRDAVLAMRAVTAIEGLSAATGPAMTGLDLRLNLRHAARGLARDRSPVSMVVSGGVGEPAGLYTEITGTLDRVGADFMELAVHAPWEPRRNASVRSVVLIPLTAIVLIRAVPLG